MTDLLGDQERVTEIEERAEAASEGPWEVFASAEGWANETGFTIGLDCAPKVAVVEEGQADAEFIAHAREDVPWLLAENARLVERLRAAEAERDVYRTNAEEAQRVGTSLRDHLTEARAELAVVKQQCSDNLREITARDALIAAQPHSDLCASWATEDGWHHPDCDCWKSAAPVSVLASHDAEAIETLAAHWSSNPSDRDEFDVHSWLMLAAERTRSGQPVGTKEFNSEWHVRLAAAIQKGAEQ